MVGDSQKQNGGLILAGVFLEGTVHDVLMDHVTMRNNYGRGAAGEYWNGDGFVAERGTYNLTFRDTVATGNTDSGYDIKGNNVTMLRASASGNTKNFRLWGAEAVTLTDSVSSNPHYFGGIGKPSHFQARERRQRHARQFPLFRQLDRQGVRPVERQQHSPAGRHGAAERRATSISATTA